MMHYCGMVGFTMPKIV
ncbi:MAG: hypothetical protein IJ485_07320 [Lachnospiraceae bacterium]|nr:hypothetical protein [Lachnospiraceae bacterium]